VGTTSHPQRWTLLKNRIPPLLLLIGPLSYPTWGLPISCLLRRLWGSRWPIASCNKIAFSYCTNLSLFSSSGSWNRPIRGRVGGINQSGVMILSNRLTQHRSSSQPYERPGASKWKKPTPSSPSPKKLCAAVENVEKNLSGQVEKTVAKPLISKLHSFLTQEVWLADGQHLSSLE
jgi:hypothetical protein